jgi:periplasmic divalent cation tolerance protein
MVVVQLLILLETVRGVRLDTELILTAFTTTGSDPQFYPTTTSSDVWIHVWSKSSSTTSGCTGVWSYTDSGRTASLCKDLAGVLTADISGQQLTRTCSTSLFTWEFLSVSFNSAQLKLCSADWSTKVLSCDAQAPANPLPSFSATTSISITAGSIHLYDLQVKFIQPSTFDIQTSLSSYTWHSVFSSTVIMSKVFAVFITTNSEEAARALAHGLVSNSWAACVNIIPQVRSVYKWQGEIHEDAEVMLVAKTTEERLPGLTEFVKANHTYEVPEVIAVEVSAGLPAYLQFVRDNVG